MKFSFSVLLVLCFHSFTLAQEVKFKKDDLHKDEPSQKNAIKKDTISVELQVSDTFPDSISVDIQKATESTYPDSLVEIITKTLDTLKTNHKVKISLATDVFDDEEKYIILTANWVLKGEKKQSKDTLFIKNTYPFKSIPVKEYTDWNDGKRAEIFIGSNFDFLNNKVTLSDWYGGIRVFLPAITNMRYNKSETQHPPRWGFDCGLYHAKSLSNFGNDFNDSIKGVYSSNVYNFGDSLNVRYDTIGFKTKREINNWGIYFTPTYQFSRFTSSDGKFVTNIHVGLLTEVIRRNIFTSFNFDTIGSVTKHYLTDKAPRLPGSLPRGFTSIYYDAYFGICAPIQFLWKDILEIKVNPCFGIGSRGYSTQSINGRVTYGSGTREAKKVPYFYLAQFDLLARLGGLRLNIGGEVRGYFPNESPIFSSYLGTSFTIQKLVDFVTK